MTRRAYLVYTKWANNLVQDWPTIANMHGVNYRSIRLQKRDILTRHQLEWHLVKYRQCYAQPNQPRSCDVYVAVLVMNDSNLVVAA